MIGKHVENAFGSERITMLTSAKNDIPGGQQFAEIAALGGAAMHEIALPQTPTYPSYVVAAKMAAFAAEIYVESLRIECGIIDDVLMYAGSRDPLRVLHDPVVQEHTLNALHLVAAAVYWLNAALCFAKHGEPQGDPVAWLAARIGENTTDEIPKFGWLEAVARGISKLTPKMLDRFAAIAAVYGDEMQSWSDGLCGVVPVLIHFPILQQRAQSLFAALN